MRSQARLQRLEPPASATNPVCQGRTVDLDAVSGEDLSLAVKRRVVAIFAHQHMCQEAGARHSLGDGPLRPRCLMDRSTRAAAIFGTANAQDPQPCRHKVEHLAQGLADHMKGTAAAKAKPALNVECHVLTGQM